MARFRALMSLAITALLIKLAMGANYTVGGEVGWDLGPNFESWSKAQSFHVGDNLIFSYLPPHDVREVTETNYESCQAANALQVDTEGNTVITLTSTGNRYFICGFVSHCTSGMKLPVTTLAATTATPPPPPATSPPTSPEVAAPPPPTVATPPAIATPPTVATPPAIASPPLPNTPSLAPVKAPILAPTKAPILAPILAPTEAPILAPVPSVVTPTPAASSPAVAPSGSSSSASSASGNRGYLLSKLTTGIWFGMLILLAL